ncbi:MAG: hypothetical protein ACRDHG_14940 [Anaerolineales bacterium]
MFGPRSAAGLSAVALLLINLPYLAAPKLTPSQSTFSGFLLNPTDGYSYLAKMRQGASGPLEFHLPYAPEPGDGAMLFVYYLLLGRLGSLARLAPLTVYQAARVIGTAAMFGAAYLFFVRMLASEKARFGAFALALFGTGIGWLAVPFGLTAVDLQVPEAIPFVTGYVNAHFPLAVALLLFSVTAIVSGYPAWLTYLASFGLALIQPFGSLTVGASLATWMLAEELRRSRAADRPAPGPAVRTWRAQWMGLLVFLLGAIPVLIYDFGAIRSHPMLGEWAAQNATPSPSLPETMLGYGLLVPLAVIGSSRARLRESAEARLLVIWVVVNGLLLYAPFPLQRRLSLGLFFPLAALAGLGLERVAGSGRRLTLLVVGTLALSLPSHGLVVASGLSSVARGDPALVIDRDEVELVRWIDLNLNESELILAGPRTGNHLPAFTPARVLYGHPFETPAASERLAEVDRLFRWDQEPGAGLARLQDLGVRYVVYSDEEQAIGSPSWIPELELVHEAGAARLYKVPIP